MTNNKLKKIYEDYAGLKITFEVFEHSVQSILKISKKKNGLENSFTIDYLSTPHSLNFSINVPTSTITNVLRKYIDGEVNLTELENWANMLIMDDDHFMIGGGESSLQQASAYDVLQQIGSWPAMATRQKIETYISNIENIE